MGDREVDQDHPADEEADPAAEVEAAGSGAGHQRQGDDGEHELVHEEHEQRDRGAVLLVDVEEHVTEREELCRITDEAAAVLAEYEAEAAEDPQQAYNADRGKDLPHDGQGILLAHKAAVEKRQARRHEEHQNGAQEHVGHVAEVRGRIDDGFQNLLLL